MRGENEIGLVLAGGGAKGAFQVGVLQAMKEEGLLPYVTAVSGTSAGALNAALLLNSNMDIDKIAEIWLDFTVSDFLGVQKLKKNHKSKRMSIRQLKRTTIYTMSSMWEKNSVNPVKMLYAENDLDDIKVNQGTKPELDKKTISLINSFFGGFASQKVISELVYKNIHIYDTFSNGIDCYITCFQNFKKTDDSTEVFLINGSNGDPFHNDKVWTPSHIHNILLASIALPIYAPVNINGKLYSDGGFESGFSRKLANKGIGNIPYNVLLEKDSYQNLVIVDFDENTIAPKTAKNIIEIKPHRSYSSIDSFLSIADFTQENIASLIYEGKKEAQKTFILFRDTIQKIKNSSQPSLKNKSIQWHKSNVYSELKELVDAIQRNQIEIRFKNRNPDINRAVSHIFSYSNSELTLNGIVLSISWTVYSFFYKIWGKKMADQIRKYDCYPIPGSDEVVLYLNII